MEINEYCQLNELIYSIYTEEDFETLCRVLLKQLKHCIRYAYASVLFADLANEGHLCHPVCEPESFLEAETRYLQYEDRDHLIWMSHSPQTMVFLDSIALSDSKRLSSDIYRDCYSHYDIYDTLQMNLTYNSHFMGSLSLYRTRNEPSFTEVDIVYLKLLSIHLNYVFYRKYYLSGKSGKPVWNDRAGKAAGKSSVMGYPAGAREGRELSRLRQELLTRREREIADYILRGVSNAVIVNTLHITEHTLNKHLQNIYRKLEISSRWELLKVLKEVSGPAGVNVSDA